MLHAVVSFINISNKWIWSWPMIILLLGTHIFMTIRTKGIQRKLGTAIKLSVTRDPGAEGEVSQFGALATALASTIGTGNIIGVGTAIASWRSWSSAVVLADWCIWNRNESMQSHLIAVKVPGKDSRWTDAGWCHVRVWRRGLQHEMAGSAVCISLEHLLLLESAAQPR